MYLEFYGLKEKPFSQTPDPRFLYWNDAYRETLASLSYGIRERKGFIAMLGEAGTGKTTLLRKLLDDLGDDIVSVFLFNPNATFEEILEYTLSELGIPSPGGRKLAMLQRLNEFLLAAYSEGRNTILLIDEAQDLESDVMESLRLLSNLETANDKILQIVLSGQPELADKLAEPGLRQLKQRIAVRCRIEPLQFEELSSFIEARLEVAGGTPNLFEPDALPVIWEFTNGIPRLINTVCDNALLLGYALGKRTIDYEIASEVAADLRKIDADQWGSAPTTESVQPEDAGSALARATPPSPAAQREPLPGPMLDREENARDSAQPSQAQPTFPEPMNHGEGQPFAPQQRRSLLGPVALGLGALAIGLWLGDARTPTPEPSIDPGPSTRAAVERPGGLTTGTSDRGEIPGSPTEGEPSKTVAAQPRSAPQKQAAKVADASTGSAESPTTRSPALADTTVANTRDGGEPLRSGVTSTSGRRPEATVAREARPERLAVLQPSPSEQVTNTEAAPEAETMRSDSEKQSVPPAAPSSEPVRATAPTEAEARRPEPVLEVKAETLRPMRVAQARKEVLSPDASQRDQEIGTPASPGTGPGDPKPTGSRLIDLEAAEQAPAPAQVPTESAPTLTDEARALLAAFEQNQARPDQGIQYVDERSTEGDEVAIEPGDTLDEIANRRYGSSNLTTLDMLRVINPEVRDVDLIIAGDRIILPEPGPRARIVPDGDGYAVLALTTETLSRALSLQSSLEERFERPVTLERIATRGGQSVFRVSLRGFTAGDDAAQIADGLGPIDEDPRP
jgi:general secretion pathway protein A